MTTWYDTVEHDAPISQQLSHCVDAHLVSHGRQLGCQRQILFTGVKCSMYMLRTFWDFWDLV